MDIEAVYRKDLATLPQLSRDEVEALIRRAKQGDLNAKQRIILAELGIVCVYAARRQRRAGMYCDFMELVGVGNFVLIEKIDEALEVPNPLAYLRKTVWYEMLQYKRSRSQVITTPTTPGDVPYAIDSLLQFTNDDGECPFPEPSASPSHDEDYTPLYNALARLSEPSQRLLCRLYGLRGYGEEALVEICCGNSTTKVYQAAKARKLWCLKKLREHLDPEFAQRHSSPRLAKQRNDLEHIKIPECTLLKLRVAEQALRQRGAKLSMNKLRIESGVNTRYASTYLRDIAEYSV